MSRHGGGVLFVRRWPWPFIRSLTPSGPDCGSSFIKAVLDLGGLRKSCCNRVSWSGKFFNILPKYYADRRCDEDPVIKIARLLHSKASCKHIAHLPHVRFPISDLVLLCDCCTASVIMCDDPPQVTPVTTSLVDAKPGPYVTRMRLLEWKGAVGWSPGQDVVKCKWATCPGNPGTGLSFRLAPRASVDQESTITQI